MHHVQGSVLTLGGDPFETAAEHSDTVAQKRAVSRIVNVAFHDTGVSAKFTSARYALLTRQARSEEHTSELQSRSDLVCRLLLEKKKKANTRLLRLCPKCLHNLKRFASIFPMTKSKQ